MEYSMTTHQGKRENNQDYSGVFMNQSNLLIALLADGLGGHQAGDIASEMTVSQLGYKWEQADFINNHSFTVKKWLNREINQENNRIYEAANQYPDLEGMGTTLVTASILKDKIIISNIGDSRGYIYNNEELKQITEDHSFVSELQRKGQLTDEEAKNHYNKNALTRSLGVKDDVEIDFFSIVKSATEMIMLSSDGLTNVVNEKEIASILADETLSIDEKSSTLVQQAVENEGSDNITVLLIDLKDSEKVIVDKAGEEKCVQEKE